MRGFSLLEVLVATTLVAVGVTALAHVVALATYANLHARHTTVASVLAQQKMEDAIAEAAAGAVTPSPAATLAITAAGYSDFVDAAGGVLGPGPTPPAGAAYLRRWAIDPMPGSPRLAWIVQVVVIDLRNRGADVRLVGAAAGKAF